MSRKAFLISLLSIFIFQATIAQTNFDDDPIFSVDNQVVPAGDFIYVYNKNHSTNEEDRNETELNNYFQLYINFKLKVSEALHRGIDTTLAFKDEYNKYKKQLIKPYIVETEELEQLTQEAYERSKQMVRASHILVKLPENATPKDTVEAYNRISDLRKKIVSGSDFRLIAQQSSDDPSAKKNGGDLGYFTSLQMVYPFENAAFETPVDSVSPIFRTRFGYHILKVYEVKPNTGTVKAAHIYINGSSDASKSKILNVYDQLQNGVDWSDLCLQYSDDTRTKNTGGELPYLTSGQLPPEFENALLDLKEKGAYTDPVQTSYGWHIIKLIDRKPLESYEELKPKLENKVKRDSRSKMAKGKMISTLSKQLNLVEKEKVKEAVFANSLNYIEDKIWEPNLPSKIYKDTLFYIYDSPYFAFQFAEFCENRKATTNSSDKTEIMESLYSSFLESSLMEQEEEYLKDTNLDFRMLMSEYREGLLLFDIMEKEVWNKAQEDTLGLQKYFNNHKDKYMFGERAQVSIFSSNDSSLLHKAFEEFQSSNPFQYLSDTISLEELSSKLKKTHDLFSNLQEMQNFKIEIQLPDPEKNSSVDSTAFKFLDPESVEFKVNDKLNDHVIVSFMGKDEKYLELKYSNDKHFVKIEKGTFEKTEKEIFDEVNWDLEINYTKTGNVFYTIFTKDKLNPSVKPLKSIRGLVISDYQGYLETEWLKQLNATYPVSVNEKIKRKAFKYLKKYE